MYGYIYLTTNLINNKKYIGQHKSNIFNDNYHGSGTNLRKAIIKYGKQNFKTILLEECESQRDLDTKEIFWIKQYNSNNPEIGYNITQGGQARFFTGLVHSESARKKMSERAKNRLHLPTTLNRKCVNKDGKNKYINVDEIDLYISNGWSLGKISNQVAWNKGLTKNTSEIVAKYTNLRNKRFKSGESIGYYGCKGDNSFKRKQLLDKIASINKEEFYNDWLYLGKCYCTKKYHLNSKSYEYICSLFNIVETDEHKKFIRNHHRYSIK